MHNVSFRRVKMDDVKMLHRWMHETHVIPFWQRNIPFDAYNIHLQEFLEDSHQTLWIGIWNEEPISYWEAYWVKDDLLGRYISYDTYDQGIHLLIGPTTSLGKGRIYPLLLTMMQRQFQVKQTKRILAEPDIRNEKMIHIFKKCGFQVMKELELPDKTALVMYCERSCFERRWQDWHMNKF